MTQPVFEPSSQRTDATLNYGARQLRRRPAPPVGGSEIPWARRSRGYDTSVQVIATGTETAIEFNHDYNYAAGQSGETYFDSQATSDIEVLRDGSFLLITGEVIWSVAPNFNYAVGIYDAVSDRTHYAQGANTGVDFNFSEITLMHRYDSGVFLHLVVTQTSGLTKNIDAAYLEVAYIGSWTGTDFLTMDPPQ